MNPRGLPEGTWIEWPSLRLWLLETENTETERRLREAIEGESLQAIERVVR